MVLAKVCPISEINENKSKNMKALLLILIISPLCSCVSGKLIRVDDPSVNRLVVQNFSANTSGQSLKSYQQELRYEESPFARAVLRSNGKFKYVDVKKQDAQKLSMLEGTEVTLPWIP